ITALDAQVAEGSPARFRVDVNDVPAADTNLRFEISGSAGAEDVVSVPRFTLTAGLWSTTVDVPTRQDDLVEGDETLTLTLLDGSAYRPVDGSDVASTTIIDNDVPELRLAGGSSVAEGDSDSIVVIADQAPVRATQVVLSTAGTATSGTDFVAVPTVHTLPAGQSRFTVDVATLTDDAIEDDERIVVSLAPGGGYTIGQAASAVTTIVKPTGDAALPLVTLRTTATHVGEGQPLPLVISLSRAITHDLPVDLVYFGTARAGDDYAPAAGRITVPAGTTSLAVNVPTVQDDAVEGDRTLGARLAASDRFRTGSPSEAVGTIESDDVPELSLLGGGSTAIVEGGSSIFTIIADQAPAEPISISFSTLGSATEGTDFESTGSTIVLPAGQTSLTVDLRTLADDVSFRPTDMIAGEWPTRVGTVFVDEGETVQPGTPLLSLTDPQLTVTLRSNASDRTKLAQGQAVSVKVVGSTVEAPGVISQLDETASIDENTGEQFYEGRVDVDGLEGADGSSVIIEVALNQVEDALTVPIASVKQDGSGQDVVRVIDLEGDGAITEVPVETGLAEGSYLEVVGGLEGGEVVVVEVDAPTEAADE
ncbi:MAG TPA: Calx-beta domain-containing protein, partial [Acidimicrobiales bacterium]|nr:Calx-beta domain-containing protein [Acidimicrobiales bacterium]